MPNRHVATADERSAEARPVPAEKGSRGWAGAGAGSGAVLGRVLSFERGHFGRLPDDAALRGVLEKEIRRDELRRRAEGGLVVGSAGCTYRSIDELRAEDLGLGQCFPLLLRAPTFLLVDRHLGLTPATKTW